MQSAFANRTQEKRHPGRSVSSLPQRTSFSFSERGAASGLPFFLRHRVQAKPPVGSSGDSLEHEADRVAASASQQGSAVAASKSANHLVQAKPTNGATQTSFSPPVALNNSVGSPLSTNVRAHVEPVLGTDLSHVRVHSDLASYQSAHALGAKAFTHQNHIWMGANQSPEDVGLMAHESAHVVQQSQRLGPKLAEPMGSIQLKPDDDVKFIKDSPGITDRIEDAYGGGSLTEIQWRTLLASAKESMAKGDTDAASRDYLALYADVAKLAQATRVVPSSRAINIVTGSKENCRNAAPGLNLFLGNRDAWGAVATTSYVDDRGKFGVTLRGRGELQPEVAIVLSVTAFSPEKEQTLSVLRHEMVHAEHRSDDATALFLSSPKDKVGPVRTSAANTELLGYLEGFMTMFHLTHPAPTSADHPAFVELLGVLDPWAAADPSVRSEALGRLQEYYCHALDRRHREAFEAWVDYNMRRVSTYVLADQEGDIMGAYLAYLPMRRQYDFFHGLQTIIGRKCKGLATPMALSPHR